MIKDRATRPINLNDFQDAGGPEKVGRLILSPPEDDQYILRMAIKADGGPIFIPRQLFWIIPMLNMVTEYQDNINRNHPFIYVTIRHGLVKSKRDDEWHVDGFSTKIPHLPEQNYIWANQDATEYAEISAKIPSDFNPRQHNINHYLEQCVTEVKKAEANTVYCMDPYVLHRRPMSTTGTKRTFIRISYVPIEINDINNTQNPMLERNYTDDGLVFRSQLVTY